MSEEMAFICDKEVNKLLYKQAFFCIWKKQVGKFRPIVNLNPLNRFIKYQHFQMEIL
jgi:hypothetical protein